MLGLKPIVEAVNITKRFPGGVVALGSVSLELYEGEAVALLGENGSGKSTLVKVLSGIYTPDEGLVKINGKEVTMRNPSDAIKHGIILISQTPQLVERLTVAENLAVFLSALKMSKPFSSIKWIGNYVEKEASKLGIRVDPFARVHTLSYTQKQLVEILKAVLAGARVLLLDEALTYLPVEERMKLYNYVLEYKKKGGTVVVITHKLSEALEVADRIVVLKDGRVRGILRREEATLDNVRYLMFGECAREITYERLISRSTSDEPVIVAKDLRVLDDYGREAVRGVNLEVRSGEIVGIAGITGNGQKELLEAIAGLRRVKSGRIYAKDLSSGNFVEVTNKGARVIRELGIGVIPENILLHGISIEDPIVVNLVALYQRNGFLVDWRKASSLAKALINELRILTRDEHTPCKLLSGGNLMKVVVGRELMYSRSALLAYNPTRALDEVTAIRVRKIMSYKALNEKLAVLLVSEDLDEVLQVSSKVYVMNSGKLYGPFDPEQTNRSEIESYMVM
ncbi:MAG: ATP-binding cassette domain-containing protein [Desulfurococcaceae archaeon]